MHLTFINCLKNLKTQNENNNYVLHLSNKNVKSKQRRCETCKRPIRAQYIMNYCRSCEKKMRKETEKKRLEKKKYDEAKRIEKAQKQAIQLKYAYTNSKRQYAKLLSCENFHDNCELKESPGCCYCVDKRPYPSNGLYDGYVYGIGVIKNIKRHDMYCPACKLYCEIHS